MPAVASVSGFSWTLFFLSSHWYVSSKTLNNEHKVFQASHNRAGSIAVSHHTILGYDASQTSLETLFIFVTLCPKSSVSLSAEVAPASLLFGNSGHSKLNTILVSLLETILAEVRNLQSISKQSFHC